jgi:peptide/nickel transport system permease protein
MASETVQHGGRLQAALARARTGRPPAAGPPAARDDRAGGLLLAALVACAILAPAIAPYSPDAMTASQILHGPSARHLLGTDDLGRDVLSRLLYAYRVSLLIAVGSIAIALPAGGLIGLLAGYFGGIIDALLMRPVEMLLAFPALLLGLTMVSVFGPGELVTVLAIAIIYTPVVARVVRSSTQVVRRELYVSSALTRGGGHLYVLARHVLPNAAGPAVAQGSVLAGVAVQIEAALSYLGLGVQPPTPSLGAMLAEGQDFLAQDPWTCVFPGLALALTVLAFNLVGGALQQRLNAGSLIR